MKAPLWISNLFNNSLRPGTKRLLVVDHEEDSRKAIVEYFLSRGYQVLSARSGVEAISKAIDKGMDVIIMKALLPGLSGYEAAPIIKKINPEVHIILTLKDDPPEDPQEAQQVDFFHCFLEPLKLEEIERAIQLPVT
ncbi:MAG: response regulator [candidate division NC10 bacterium]|nr:response regulator [candidate division NC10 bacterium]